MKIHHKDFYQTRPEYSDQRDFGENKFNKEYNRKDDFRDHGGYKKFKNNNTSYREGKYRTALDYSLHF